MRNLLRARLKAYFFTGVLITAPAAITIWLAWEVIGFFDNQVRSLIPAHYDITDLAPFRIPGFGLLLFVVAMMLIVALTANLVSRYIVTSGERILAEMLDVRSVYDKTMHIFHTALPHKSVAIPNVALLVFYHRRMMPLMFTTLFIPRD